MHQPTSEMPDLRRLATHERVAAMTSWLRARGLVVEDAASAQRAWHAERKKIRIRLYVHVGENYHGNLVQQWRRTQGLSIAIGRRDLH